MSKSVIADLVSLGDKSSGEGDVRLDVLTDEEEGRARATRSQRVENLRRPTVVRSVVERQGDPARM